MPFRDPAPPAPRAGWSSLAPPKILIAGVLLLLSARAEAAPRQNVLEYVHEKLRGESPAVEAAMRKDKSHPGAITSALQGKFGAGKPPPKPEYTGAFNVEAAPPPKVVVKPKGTEKEKEKDKDKDKDKQVQVEVPEQPQIWPG